MNAADNFSTMTDLITQSSHCVTELNEILQSELECLRDNNAKELIQLSQNKEALMLQLHSLDNERKKLTTKNNIKTKEEYLQWLSQLDSTLELKKKWLALSEEILDCQQQNTRNGIISENMATASRQALNILSGNTIPADSSTYTANGKKPDNSASLHNTTA